MLVVEKGIGVARVSFIMAPLVEGDHSINLKICSIFSVNRLL